MKNIIKETIIGTFYLFGLVSFGAVLIITLYTLAGK